MITIQVHILNYKIFPYLLLIQFLIQSIYSAICLRAFEIRETSDPAEVKDNIYLGQYFSF